MKDSNVFDVLLTCARAYPVHGAGPGSNTMNRTLLNPK